MPHYHVIIIGAGAAGLMCAQIAAKRGKSVLLIEHTAHIGEKIRISGGGRCNFTNIGTTPQNYISANPHFAASALTRYTPQDFLKLIGKHHIAYHEKTLGQLFCDGSSTQIIAMLTQECAEGNVTITTNCTVNSLSKESHFTVHTSQGIMSCDSLVIASGGLSIPKLGATGFGYQVATQFAIPIVPTKPALVPLLMSGDFCEKLSGISVDSVTATAGISFRENTLFTHRGLSGPAILQISSYLQAGQKMTLNLLPNIPILEQLKAAQQGKHLLQTILSRHLSKRLAVLWCDVMCGDAGHKILAEVKGKTLESIAHGLQHWEITPSGNEGYAKAEVTAGGIDTKALSSRTMEATNVPGLYFIGEVVDVTGWLGGYNFQWAWASGVAAGESV